MAKITLKGNEINTQGNLPEVGKAAPRFKLTKSDLSELNSDELAGKRVILNIFPSLDTDVCAASVRKFNQEATKLDNTVVVNVSKDLPFAHSRFCSAEGIDNVISTSNFRDTEFGNNYGIGITDGPLSGLNSRAVVLIDEDGVVRYTEQVPEITQEPDYNSVLGAIEGWK